MNVQYGRPEDIVDSLEQEEVFGADATHLIAAIQAESTPLDQVRRPLEVLATEVAPALGWRPRSLPVASAEEKTNDAQRSGVTHAGE